MKVQKILIDLQAIRVIKLIRKRSFNRLNRSLGPKLAKTLRKSTQIDSRFEAHPGH